MEIGILPRGKGFCAKKIFDFFLRPFLRIYSKKNQDKFNVSRYYIYIYIMKNKYKYEIYFRNFYIISI